MDGFEEAVGEQINLCYRTSVPQESFYPHLQTLISAIHAQRDDGAKWRAVCNLWTGMKLEQTSIHVLDIHSAFFLNCFPPDAMLGAPSSPPAHGGDGGGGG